MEKVITRKKSTRAQKIAAVELVRRNCEHGLPIREAHIKQQFGVGQVPQHLIANKVIKLIKGEVNKYVWEDVRPIPEIVDSIWTVHGTEDNRKPEPVKEVVTVTRKEEPVAPTPVPAPKKAPEFNRLQGEIEMCLQRCKEYGITNVSKYIADHLIYLGVKLPQTEKGTLAEHLLH